MSDQRVQRFHPRQPLTQLRPQLNALVDAVNDRGPAGPAGTVAPFATHNILYLQVRDFEHENPGHLVCVLPGQELNPSAQTWTVELPTTFTELSRDGVAYVYTDINNRTADDTEVQKLTPIYLLNDLVMAIEAENGAAWRDLNIDGRQWAALG